MDNDNANAANAATAAAEAATVLGGDASSAMEPMRAYLEKTVQTALNDALSDYIDGMREAGAHAARNGSYPRTYKTLFGAITVEMPRDRASGWHSCLPEYGRSLPMFDDMIIKLYKTGLSFEETAAAMKETTGCSVSAKTCQAVVRSVYSAAIEFNSRPIPDCPIVYMDGTWLPLRREGASGGKAEYEGECIMVAVGIDASGRKNVLGYWIKPTEGASKWEEILGSLKSRGLRSPRLFVTDGLSGMPEAISNVFPGAKHQRCWVHLVRNMTSDARKKDRDEISGDAKRIYGSRDRASAEAELRSFVSKWARRYPSFEKYLTMPGLFEFMSFPSKAWPSLYTSNVIEGFNSVLKRKLRSRAAMNSLGNAYYLITNACERYNESRRVRRIAGFDEMTAEELASLGMRR